MEAAEPNSNPMGAPTGVVIRSGDRSVVLHWQCDARADLTGYCVYRAQAEDGRFAKVTPQPVPLRGFADLNLTNGRIYLYRVRAVDSEQQESPDSESVSARPMGFANDEDFLSYLQQTAFDYFWYEANPANGLIPDRSRTNSYCSIAAVGFGLTAIGIGIDHGWIRREQGRARVLTTLKTFWEKPQGTNDDGMIGYKGWFYHFLDMNTGVRAWKSELSSIDTGLLLAGMIYARGYFNGAHADEAAIREIANRIYKRVDWNWMKNGTNSLTLPSGTLSRPTGEGRGEGNMLSMGWYPESGFIKSRWIGYNEAMLLYLLGLGAPADALAPACWRQWTSGYQWKTSHGQSFVHFPPLFGHQYSHCWIDFRGIADDYMRDKGLDYFENSRRATLAQRAYCIANPGKFQGYGELAWGLTACDGPSFVKFQAYSARGAPPPENDDGTIAPTAVGASIPFAPEICIPTLRHFYDRFRTNIWTSYGFCDAFNLTANWWDPEVLGIDQGPMVIMIENYRTGGVWKTFMKAPEIQRGLRNAGFRNIAP